ncbi:porin [uncultured Treponema sp.]|uniref:porin n=1 Tax=uncultured Treponema sp. TaxID=162155 RepID=UPI002586D8E2|nr:porin [uncultured Treponema sp.]
MKKTLIAVAAAAALTATSAFAEITFGAWLRVLASPVASTGEDIIAGVQNSWGWGARTARININGTSEDGKAGFVMGVYNDFESGLGQGDDAYLWVKPVDTVKVSVGKFDSPTNGLRGDFCYGSWNWLRPGNWVRDGEGLTFDGIWRSGLMVEADPMEGLHAFAVIPMSSSYKSAEETYRNIQVGFGYTIEGVGKLKAQFIGDYGYTTKNKPASTYHFDTETGTGTLDDDVAYDKDQDKTTGQIGVAFDITAIENLYVTVGARFGIADKDYAPDYLKMEFSAGASYQVSETMKFSVDGDYKQFQKKFNKDDDSLFSVGAGVDFTVMDGLAAVADVRYMSNKYGKDGDDGAISFLVGVNKSVSSNGSLGIGFQGATNGCGLVMNDGTGIKAGQSYTLGKDGGDGDEFVWAIPVSVSVWF